MIRSDEASQNVADERRPLDRIGIGVGGGDVEPGTRREKETELHAASQTALGVPVSAGASERIGNRVDEGC